MKLAVKCRAPEARSILALSFLVIPRGRDGFFFDNVERDILVTKIPPW